MGNGWDTVLQGVVIILSIPTAVAIFAIGMAVAGYIRSSRRDKL